MISDSSILFLREFVDERLELFSQRSQRLGGGGNLFDGRQL
ncbi:MAG: hypothetical protein K0R47_1374 [Brevibacillus sp.]|nr:hypothetical protein [Brevibacillus sp.]